MNKILSKGEETKHKIIDIAADLFIRNGYTATTTREITDELGMTRGIIYNYFKSKEEIFEAVIEKFHPWLQITIVVTAVQGDSIEEFVHHASEELVKRWNKNAEFTKLHFIELVEFNGQHLSNLFQNVFDQMVEILEEKKKTNKALSNISTGVLSRSLLGLFFGYLMGDKFTSVPMGIENQFGTFDYFTDIYLKGVISEVNKSQEKKDKGEE